MSGWDRTPQDWEIEVGGLRLLLEATLEIGRDPTCAVPLDDERVSWRHLRVEPKEGQIELLDLDSKNGTFLNGRLMDPGPAFVHGDALIQVGSTRARLRRVSQTTNEGRGRFRRIPIRGRTLRIGRAPDNDVRLEEPNVSWSHAELTPGEPPSIADLGSRNGVRLNGQLIRRAEPLGSGAIAGIGPFALRVENDELVVSDERGARLTAVGVSVQVPRTILWPTNLTVAPGEFIALIGASGSGKTTLLKSLAGVKDPTSGRVLIGTDPIDLRLTEVGYVPQTDVLHDRLTVRETLMFTARLRLPSDTSRAECAVAVEEVLEELRLAEHAGTSVNRLSGGQRKRLSCGVELIAKPSMVLLDEPTSGLDPPLERRLMATLRQLSDSGRGIVVVTHATSSLALCDTVAVMGEGGHLLFTGSPRECLERFHVGNYDEIYGAAELVEPPAVPEPGAARRSSRAAPGPLLAGRSLLRQTATLIGRYAHTLGRDRRTIGALLGQAPLIGFLIAMLYSRDVLALPDTSPTRSAQFMFLLVTAALWLGLIDSCREIVKERAIILRELAVGVRLDAQIIAKSVILFAVAAVQCLLLIVAVAALRPFHCPLGTYAEILGLLTLTSWAMVGLGLLVSTLARSVDQATSVIPLLLIPQLLFGGALVALERMGTLIKILADLTVSRWAFAGVGSAINMNSRLAEEPKAAHLSGYGIQFFSIQPGVAAIILAGFTGAALLAASLVLARRSRDI